MVMHEIDCGSMTRLSRKRVENELKIPREGRIYNTRAISNLHIYLFTNFSEKLQVPIYVELGLTYVRWLVRGVAHREKNK